MSNVVALHDNLRLLVCNCGCSTFHAMSDGSAECAACGDAHDMDGSGWISRNDDRVYTGDDIFSDVQGNGSVDFTRRRVAQVAASPNAVALFVIREGGELTTWTSVETEEQIAWLERRLVDAMDLIKKRHGA